MSSSLFELRLATQPVLEDIAREGARRMLQHAIEQEGAGYIDPHQQAVDENGVRFHFTSRILPPYLRKTNPIESTFATVHLRTCRTKGPGSREAGLAMVFKLVEQPRNDGEN